MDNASGAASAQAESPLPPDTGPPRPERVADAPAVLPPPRPGRLVIALLGGLLALALAGSVALALPQPAAPPVIGPAPAFALVDQLDRPITSADLRGSVVVVNFVYTTCPDICPTLSLQMRALQERLRQERLLGSEVKLLSFTVDPARDTPPVLRAYAERYGADPDAWRFLTGPPAAVLAVITGGFYQAVQSLPASPTDHGEHDGGVTSEAPSEVWHGSRFVLIDRDWRVRAYYTADEVDPERVTRDVRTLLRR